jgi:protoheme IX farnesyltransferase
MVGLSLLPVFLGYLGVVYAFAAVLSGAFFLYRNCELLKDTSKAVAWKNFKASMVYLGVLFAAVIVDAAIIA